MTQHKCANGFQSKATGAFGQLVSLQLLVCEMWSHGHYCPPLEAQKSTSHTLKEQQLHSPCGLPFLKSHSEEEVCWIDYRPLRSPQFIPGLQVVLSHLKSPAPSAIPLAGHLASGVTQPSSKGI